MIAAETPTTLPADPDERRWQAVLKRDRASDGAFVFAVSSTGIYCRPSCPSRRPRRERVVFYISPGEAVGAGFRPCRRCHPERVAETDPQCELIQKTCRFLEEHLEDRPTLATLGAEAGMSPHHLQRVFKRALGISPRQYADALRLNRVKRAMRDGSGVTEALYEAGYGSSSRLYERAASQLGMTPGAYRRGGKNMSIRYQITTCRMGRLLVATTARGICAVNFGDSDDQLETALHREFPAAQIERATDVPGPWLGQLLSSMEGRGVRPDLPLDLVATAFQRQVWEVLMAIPIGSTRSYGEVARAIGRPTATRAVARACATNPVALVIPCHRVIREDGGLGGYRWGIERKKDLLERESRQACPPLAKLDVSV